MKKLVRKVLFGAAMTLMMTSTAFGAGWKKDHKGWWWNNDDGSWPASKWEWLDGNQDGIAECYYFDANGYMLSNTTTPDGYQVNADGAWVENGVVKTKQLSPYLHKVVVQNVGHRGGEITDGKSIEKLEFNQDLIDIYNMRNVSQTDFLKKATYNPNVYMYKYKSDYNGKIIEYYLLEKADSITSIRTTVDVVFPGFPEEGMELNAFYENTGLKMQMEAWTTTGNSDARFELPQATYRFTQARISYTLPNGNESSKGIYILLTPGSDGKWYIYRENRVVAG